ncbi:MAG: hypothetical protein U0L09_08410 [Christensenellales bacterium]|nr:hypothetical protein [Christensenellales bacterium]
MDDFLEQVARRKHQGIYTIAYYMMWVALVFFGFTAVLYVTSVIGVNESGGLQFNYIGLIIGLVCAGITFLIWRKADYCRMEYDYSFTNGVLDISQVLNNKRRRYLTALEMKEVICCGPVSAPAFQKALGERDVKRHNWFLNRDANLYFFLFSKKNAKHLAIVELRDDLVSMIRSKSYLQRGVWADDDGKSGYGVS